MLSKRFVIVFALFLCSIAFAQRDYIKNPTSIGPQLGYHKAADADDANLMYGAALRLKLTNSLGFEGSINYRREEFHKGNIAVDSWPVLLTGMIYPAEVIYGAAGVGWYNTKIDFSENLNNVGLHDKTSSRFGWHFGAGLEIPLGNPVMLTTDFRYVFLDYDFGEVPGAGEINSDFFIVTAGLLFRIN